MLWCDSVRTPCLCLCSAQTQLGEGAGGGSDPGAHQLQESQVPAPLGERLAMILVFSYELSSS